MVNSSIFSYDGMKTDVGSGLALVDQHYRQQVPCGWFCDCKDARTAAGSLCNLALVSCLHTGILLIFCCHSRFRDVCVLLKIHTICMLI